MQKILTFSILFSLVAFTHAQVTLWGTASAGGAVNGSDSTFISPINGNGTVFNIRSDGSHFTVAHDFNSGYIDNDSDNAYAPPFGNLIQATLTNGLLYGLGLGGNYGAGVIFSVDPTTNAYQELYQFNDPYGDYNNGGEAGGGYDGPGSLIQASDGNLYGMTQYGGSNGNGSIFSFDPTTNTYTDLYDFSGLATPAGDLLEVGQISHGGGGVFYGMTMQDGANGYGTIFSFNPRSLAYNDLYDFDGTHGQWPTGNLVQSSYDGNLYGMTPNGGMYGNGVLFSYNISASTYTDVGDFTGSDGANGGASPGANPFGSLVEVWNASLEPNGPLLYGTTSSGDLDNGNNGGVLFYYDPSQGSYNLLLDVYDATNVYDATTATNPFCNLMQASDGNLYGMLQNGGNYGLGILLGCDTFGNVINRYPSYDLIDFDGSTMGMGGNPGMYPSQSLMQATNGLLYGMTYWGNDVYEDGNLFSAEIGRHGLTETDIIDFNNLPPPYYAGGFTPNGLVQAGNGLLYGMTQAGGTYAYTIGGNNYNGGVIYSIDPSTNAFTTIINFGSDTTNGGSPFYQLTLGADGKLYGTAAGGYNSWGTIFSLDTLGNYTDLVDFGQLNGYGYGSLSGLVQANNGLMYGVNGPLISFNPATVSDANPPNILTGSPGGSGLIQASNGVLYGVSPSGGAYNYGILYSIDTLSNFNTLYSFNHNNGNIGSNPSGYLVQANNGLLYGMTNGASCNCGNGGVLFSFDTNTLNPSPYTELFDFTPTTGYNPSTQIACCPTTINGSLYQASDGNLYGSTTDGGPNGGDGEVFQYNYRTNTYTPLYNLTGTNGFQPQASFIELRSLATSAVPGSLCAGTTVNVPFTATGLFTYANVFTAQLSDASGNFSSPVNIGTLAGTTSDTITATIPEGTTPGAGYRIRVVAVNPNFAGSDNGSNISINAAVIPDVSVAITSGTNPMCSGASVTFTATPTNGGINPDLNFEVNGGSVQNGTSTTYTTATLNNNDAVTVVMTSNAACPSQPIDTSNSITMTVNAIPTITSTTSGSRCGAGTVVLGATASAGIVNWYTVSTGGSSVATGTSYTTPSVSSTTDYYADASSNGCTTASRTEVTATVNSCGPTINTWLGNSNVWGTGTNWSIGNAPTCEDTEDSIPATANDPVISSSANAGNIVVNSGVSITLNANLSVCGNWTGGATSNASVLGSSALVLTGTSAQTVGGHTQFNTLQVDNTSGGVSLASAASVSISGSLVLQNGNINTNSSNGGTLTFTSTSLTQNAIIDNFSEAAGAGLGTITGNIIAQRYYSTAALFGQHMIGSPVSGITTGSLGSYNPSGAYITPTSDCDELHSANGTAYGNVFSYHESNGASCPMAEWYVEPSSTSPVPGQGYSVVLTHPGSTFSLTGTANLTSSYEITDLTNSDWTKGTLQRPGNTYISGWSLVSNPYLAPLNAVGVASDNSANFDDGILIWDNTTGAYVDVTTVSPYTIAPFQAFLVHRSVTDLTGATYTINGTNRVVTTATFSREQNPEVLSLTATNTTTGITDQTTVGFNSNASTQFTPTLDFHKIPNDLSRHSLYTLKNDLWMLRNYSPSISQTATVQVGLEPGVSGNYTFGFDGLSSFDPTSYIILEDTKLNVMYDVRNGGYNFIADAVNDSWNRFVLHFTPPTVISATDATCDAPGLISIQQPGTANWNYTIANANSILISSGTLNASSPVVVNSPAGIYTLTLTDDNGYTVVKNVQVGGAQPIAASIATSAKTVQQNQVITMIGTADNASSFSWIFGDGATASGPMVTHSYQNEGAYTIVLNVVNASGCTSQTTQDISVTPRSTTGLPTLSDNEPISIWSNTDLLYVDFTKINEVDATIDVYDILGQKLYSDKYTTNTVYTKQINNIEVGYIIVRVMNNDETITKKVFISNDK